MYGNKSILIIRLFSLIIIVTSKLRCLRVYYAIKIICMIGNTVCLCLIIENWKGKKDEGR